VIDWKRIVFPEGIHAKTPSREGAKYEDDKRCEESKMGARKINFEMERKEKRL